MNRPTLPTASPTVLLDLPAVAGRSALRAGLMAMRVPPGNLPADRRDRDAVLRTLGAQARTVAFVDISRGGGLTSPSLLELDAEVARDDARRRIFLTRIATGHVSAADRQWVQSLGFADLLPEFEALDCEGALRTAVDAVARQLSLTPLDPAELARYARVMNDDRAPGSPRSVVRSRAGSSAEALAALLASSLDIADRSYRLQSYPQCFVGSDAVGWIAAHRQCSRPDAVALGQALGELGLLVHVAQEHPFLDDRLYYRLAVSAAADRVPLGDAFALLRSAQGPAVANRVYLGKTYAACWIGHEAIDVVAKAYSLARHEAWIVLHRLAQFGVIEHVTRSRPFVDGAFFYRFAGLPPGHAGRPRP